MSNENNNDDESKVVHLKERAKQALARKENTDEPVIKLPPVVKRLCLAIMLVQAAMSLAPTQTANMVSYDYGFLPARLTGDYPLGLNGALSLVTHMFIHGGWLHMGINVGTLMAFGSALEKQVGGKKLLLLFLVTGVLGALTHLAFFPHSESPLIGASGAISGLFGAVLVSLHDQGHMGDAKAGWRGLMPFVIVWIGISVFFGFFGMPGAEGPIAWTTHIGGFVAGLFIFRP